MSNTTVFDRTVSQIQDRLSLITRSHKLVSNNLANASTPGYRAKDISFKSYLQESMNVQRPQLVKSNERHLAGDRVSSPGMRAEIEDAGPVNLEQEMMKLARNSVEYQYMVTLLNKKFASLKLAITEGAN